MALNIEQHLMNQRANTKIFSENHPGIVAEIHDMITNTISKREKLIQQYPDRIPLDYFKQLAKDTESNTLH